MSENDWSMKYAAELAYGDSTVIPPAASQNLKTKSKGAMEMSLAQAKKKAFDVKTRLTTMTRASEKSDQLKSSRKADRTKSKQRISRKNTNSSQKSQHIPSLQRDPDPSTSMGKVAENASSPKTAGRNRTKLATKMAGVKNRMRSSGVKFLQKIKAARHADSSRENSSQRKSKSALKEVVVQDETGATSVKIATESTTMQKKKRNSKMKIKSRRGKNDSFRTQVGLGLSKKQSRSKIADTYSSNDVAAHGVDQKQCDMAKKAGIAKKACTAKKAGIAKRGGIVQNAFMVKTAGIAKKVDAAKQSGMAKEAVITKKAVTAKEVGTAKHDALKARKVRAIVNLFSKTCFDQTSV